jgi:hypothetical protein
VLKTLTEQAHALAVMPENLDQISSFASEDEDVTTVGIAVQRLLHLKGQPVHAAPHVGMAGRQPDPGPRREADHRRRRAFITAPMTAVMATGSTVPDTLTRTPPDSVISIEPGLAGAAGAVAASDSGGEAGPIWIGTSSAAGGLVGPVNCRRQAKS